MIYAIGILLFIAGVQGWLNLRLYKAKSEWEDKHLREKISHRVTSSQLEDKTKRLKELRKKYVNQIDLTADDFND